MKNITAEMKKYLAMGMREELDKDTDDKVDYTVRCHKGMRHETNRDVAIWTKCYQIGDEKNGEIYYDTLLAHYRWWKNYFDVSPEYAREQEDLRWQERQQSINRSVKNFEEEQLAAFLALE